MAIHIIPEHEAQKHIKSSECVCGPELKMDDETGEMVWAHNIMDWDVLVDGIVMIGAIITIGCFIYFLA